MKRHTAATATNANNSGQRVVRISWLLPSTPVRKPISGSNAPSAMRPVKPASRNAPIVSTRSLCTPLAISDLLDVRPAEQALRQEDQSDGQHGEGGDVLVVEGKVGRPERVDQGDQDAGDDGARQRAEA